MKIETAFKHILFLACLISTHALHAHQDGITGLYQNGCGACHGGAANNATQLSLTGSTSVKAGTQETYTFRVANANKTAAGFNLAILSGAGVKQSELAGANGIQLFDGELTHTQPKAFNNGGADFQFKWTAPAAHGTYTLYAAGNAVDESQTYFGDVWNTFSKTLTVTGATITGPPTGQAYCLGETITITWTQTGISNIKIDLSKDDFATSTPVVASVAGNAGTYSYTIATDLAPSSNYAFRLLNAATGDVLAKSMLFTISGAPTVATQPEDQLICIGRTLQLVAGASGKSPTYQWRHNGTIIPGATDAVYRVPSTTADDAGEYDCVISACTKQVTTNKALVTMQSAPAITTQTEGNQDLCEGETLSLAVTATGDGLIYEWYKNGSIVVGASGPSLVIQGVTIGNEGTYRCRVSGSCNPADTTTPVVVDVLEKPSITGQPTDVTVKSGSKLTLIVGANGDKLKYQWYKNGVPIANATSQTYVVAAVAVQDSGLYRCKVGNECDSMQSNPAKVTVTPPDGPGILTLGSDLLELGSIGQCKGADTTITAFVSNSGGTPVTITSITTDQPAVVQILGVSLPLELAPGATHDLRVVVTPANADPIQAKVTFFANVGKAEMTINAVVHSDLAFSQDTVVFAAGVVGDVRCATTMSLPCANATITSITIEGAGASSYQLSPPIMLPKSITNTDALELCLSTTQTSGASARVVVKSTAGDTEVELVRKAISDVSDTEVIEGLTIAPNPMSDIVRITLPTEAATQVDIYSVLGSKVQTLFGNGSIVWNGTDGYGNKLHSGMYILIVQHGKQVSMQRLLLR